MNTAVYAQNFFYIQPQIIVAKTTRLLNYVVDQSMTEEYEAYKRSLAGDSPDLVEDLRPGTVSFLAGPLKAPLPFIPLARRVFAAVMAVWSLSSAATQIYVAITLFRTLPGVSIVILAKELFGLVMIAHPAIQAFKTRPVPRVFEKILYPFPSSSQFWLLNPVIYGLGGLSNCRCAVVQAINCRWDTSSTHLGHDNDLMKIGNLLVMCFTFTITAYEKKIALRLWFFKDVLLSALALVYGFVTHFMAFAQLNDVLVDIENGKIGQNGLRVTLESIYEMVNGERPTSVFCQGLVAGKIAAAQEKAKSD
jgi:hypothetical protein